MERDDYQRDINQRTNYFRECVSVANLHDGATVSRDHYDCGKIAVEAT